MEKAKISIVIPIYNTEKYINRCIDSVLSQGMDDIQIICVNDASTDGTIKKLCDYNDARIKIYNNAINRGAGYSKNFGLSKCIGKYIMMLDSDDWILPGSLQYLYDIAEKEEADHVYYGMLNVNEGKEDYRTDSYMGNPHECYTIYRNGILLLNDMVQYHRIRTGSHNFFKRDLLYNDKISFTEGTINDDMEFTLYLLNTCNTTVYLRKEIYVYFHRKSGSVSERANTSLFWAEYFTILNRVISDIKENSCELVWNRLYQAMSLSCLNAFYVMAETEKNKFYDILYRTKGLQPKFVSMLIDSDTKSEFYDISDTDIKMLKKCKNIYIYGAGRYAVDLYRVLNGYNIPVVGFIETFFEEGKYFLDKKVYHLKEISNENSFILIGVSGKYYLEVLEGLNKGNYSIMMLGQNCCHHNKTFG